MVHHQSYPRPFNDSLYYLISALSYDKNEDEVTVMGVGGAATGTRGTCYL
jgi:hypothetical protein